MTQEETTFIAEGPFQRMSEMRRLLEGAGIAAQIVRPPGTHSNG